MVRIGQYNKLKVVKLVDFGAYLDGGEGLEILLPAKYISDVPNVGDEIDVFIYTDSEDRLIATTERPYATVGQFAYLEVNAVNRVGAFLDWGLPKDLLVPFSEQKAKMKDGGIYLVYVYLDDTTKRVVASSKIEKFLGNTIPKYRAGDEVTILPYKHTEIGYKCIVDNAFNGMLYENELYRPVVIGEETKARIKHVRDDFKIDLTPGRHVADRMEQLASEIMENLNREGGRIDVGDKSHPEEIKTLFHCSKKDFKKAIGLLYKKKLIRIEANSIFKS